MPGSGHRGALVEGVRYAFGTATLRGPIFAPFWPHTRVLWHVVVRPAQQSRPVIIAHVACEKGSGVGPIAVAFCELWWVPCRQ